MTAPKPPNRIHSLRPNACVQTWLIVKGVYGFSLRPAVAWEPDRVRRGAGPTGGRRRAHGPRRPRLLPLARGWRARRGPRTPPSGDLRAATEPTPRAQARRRVSPARAR